MGDDALQRTRARLAKLRRTRDEDAARRAELAKLRDDLTRLRRDAEETYHLASRRRAYLEGYHDGYRDVPRWWRRR